MSEPDSTLLAEILRESMVQGQNPGLTLTSNSMYPLLKIGDRIHIEQITPTELKQGDIITLIDDSDHSQLLTHRYWGKALNGNALLLLTRGDRPLEFDVPFSASKLVGRVVIRQRDQQQLNLRTGLGKWLNNWLTKCTAADMHRLSKIDWLDTAVAPNPIILAEQTNRRIKQKSQTFYKRLWRGIHLYRNILVVLLIDWLDRIF